MKFKPFVTSVILASAMCFTALASDSTPAQDQAEKKDISSFGDYKWGTSYDDVFQGEITSDMIERADYSVEEETDYGMKTIEIKHGSVGGYDASVAYLFSDSGLNAAGYVLDLVGTEEVSDIIDKYETVYGDATVTKSFSATGTCVLWVDDLENKIVLLLDEEEEESSDAIIYFAHDSDFWDLYAEDLKDSIDLDKELNKIGNTDGI